MKLSMIVILTNVSRKSSDRNCRAWLIAMDDTWNLRSHACIRNLILRTSKSSFLLECKSMIGCVNPQSQSLVFPRSPRFWVKSRVVLTLRMSFSRACDPAFTQWDLHLPCLFYSASRVLKSIKFLLLSCYFLQATCAPRSHHRRPLQRYLILIKTSSNCQAIYIHTSDWFSFLPILFWRSHDQRQNARVATPLFKFYLVVRTLIY